MLSAPGRVLRLVLEALHLPAAPDQAAALNTLITCGSAAAAQRGLRAVAEPGVACLIKHPFLHDRGFHNWRTSTIQAFMKACAGQQIIDSWPVVDKGLLPWHDKVTATPSTALAHKYIGGINPLPVHEHAPLKLPADVPCTALSKACSLCCLQQLLCQGPSPVVLLNEV